MGRGTVPRLRVAAGILFDESRRVLVAERVGGGPFTGMWEFPGGKIGAGETTEAALVRELREEIGVEADRVSHFMQLVHSYPDRTVDLTFFVVERWRGTPRGLEGQALRWLPAEAIDDNIMLPADKPVIEALVALTA